MSEQKYSDELITQYLLGSLSEADAERFDELSISDDRFADLLRAAENDLLDAYVQGDLTGAELKRFESHYLVSPLRREKAGFAEGFYEWSRTALIDQAETTQAKVSAKNRRASWFSGLSIFGAGRPLWQWGLTFATLALLFAGGWLVFEKMRAPRQIAQTEGRDPSGDRSQQQEPEGQPSKQVDHDLAGERAERERLEQERRTEEQQQRLAEQERVTKEPQRGVSIASFVLTPQMRDAGQVPQLSIPPDKNQVVMHLQLEPNEFRAYRVYLLDGSGARNLWQSSTMRARATENTRTLEVRLRSGLLKPQAYILRVKGVAAGGSSETVGDYPFKIK